MCVCVAQVKPLLDEQLVIISTALKYNIPAAQALFATAGSVSLGHNAASFWKSIALQLDITPQQRDEFSILLQTYNSRIAKLKKTSSTVVKSLTELVECAVDDDGAAPPPPAAELSLTENLQAVMEKYCSVYDNVGKMSKNSDGALGALLGLLTSTGNVWTFMQRVKIVALSHPVFADTVQLLNVVVELSDAELSGRFGGGGVDFEWIEN